MHTTTTIKDVAAAAGVAESSVSRILSSAHGYSYSDETRVRVREAALRLGYRANAAARLLKQQKKNLIGVAVQLTVHPYLNQLVIAVRDEVLKRGYEPILVEPTQLLSSATRTPFPSPEMLAGVLSLDLSIGQTGSEQFQGLRRELPLVALYPVDSDEIDWVYTDGALAIEMVVNHLVELGHRHIAFAEAPESSYHSDHLKIEGWHKAIRKHDLNPKLARLIEVGFARSIEERVGRIEMQLLSMQPRPTALICTGDESALCVMGRLQARGWNIPRDFSIVGYDGIAFGGYSYPALTTVVQPFGKIAQVGVQRLLDLVEQRHEEAVPRRQRIEPELLVRGSTGKMRIFDG